MDQKKKKLSLGDIIRKMNDGVAQDPDDSPRPLKARSKQQRSDDFPVPRLIIPPAPDEMLKQSAAAAAPAEAVVSPKPDIRPPVPAPLSIPQTEPVAALAPQPAIPELSHAPMGQVDDSDSDDDDEEAFDLYRYIGVLMRRRMVVVAVAIGFAVFSLFSFVMAPKYYSVSARLLFRPDQNVIGQDRSWNWYDQEKIFNTHLELLKSNIVLERVALNFEGRITPARIGAGLTIKQGETAGEKTDIIELSFKHPDAAMARDALNDLCRTYIEYHREVNAQEDTRLIINLKTQIDKLQTDLVDKENALRRFKEDNRLIQLSSEANIVVTKLTGMEVELQTTQLGLLTSKEQLTTLNSQIHQQDITIVQSMTYENPFQKRIAELELELNTMSTEYGPDHFKVRTAKQQIETLKQSMQSQITHEAVSKTLIKNPIRENLLEQLVSLTVEVASLEAKRTAQEQLIEKLNTELLRLPSMEQQYAYLQRETDSRLQTLTILKQKYEEAKIERDSKESDIKVLELAKMPQSPISSKRFSSVLMGILVGLILGIALAFLLEYLDQTLKDVSQVEKMLELPLLGIVPHVDLEAQSEQMADGATAAKSMMEPFRALRANLKHLAGMHNAKILMVCSAVKGEGKTTMSVNLALTFSLDGKKVILVDCDLRRSQIHHYYFNAVKGCGVNEYLNGSKELSEIIKPTRHENLFIITSGERPHNPSELLGTDRFDQLIAELRQQADIIIFDSPALLPVSDSLIMAPKMDACLMIVRTLWTPIQAARQAKNQLKRIGTKILGCIVNGVPQSRGYYPYYYGYYSYRYSYDDEPHRPLSLRQFGLTVESGLKDGLENLKLSIPHAIAVAGRFSRHVTRKVAFWFLLLLLIAITGVRLYVERTRPKPQKEDAFINYIGEESSGGKPYEAPISVVSTPRSEAPEQSTGAVIENVQNSQARQSGAPGVERPDGEPVFPYQNLVTGWVTATNTRDSRAFAALYDKDEFQYPGGGYLEWIRENSAKWLQKEEREVIMSIDTIRAHMEQGSYCRTEAEMIVRTGNDTMSLTRTMVWRYSQGAWRIIREKAQVEP